MITSDSDTTSAHASSALGLPLFPKLEPAQQD
jgi:hypothetical protein